MMRLSHLFVLAAAEALAVSQARVRQMIAANSGVVAAAIRSARAGKRYHRGDRSRYMPHQGKRECARRRRKAGSV